MLSYIFVGLIGLFVGWATPQPTWAKLLIDKLRSFIAK